MKTGIEDRKNGHKKEWWKVNELTTHHVHSQVRFPWLKNLPWNKIKIPRSIHAAYHIFYNEKPPKEIVPILCYLYPIDIAFEITKYLNKNLWNNLYKIKRNKNSISIKLKTHYAEEAAIKKERWEKIQTKKRR